MNRWLVKTEPAAYSFQALQRDRRTVWDGVKNALALKHLGRMRGGDLVLVYHTGTERAAVGIARVAGDPYADPTKKDPKLLVVELAAERELPRPVTLAELKSSSSFEGFDLLRLPRLSVMPVSASHWSLLESLAKRAAK
jgi:predicted RNA-binding protein with PUA-like domain